MREISPAVGMSVDDYLDMMPAVRPMIEEIRRQKEAGERRRPSDVLTDYSKLLSPEVRRKLLDRIAELVDENYAGRSEMCLQFAELLHRALTYLSFPSRAVLGTAIYFDTREKEIFRWEHAWVRVGEEVIDGNIDSTYENPLVPEEVRANPYWGPITSVPKDRRLQPDLGISMQPDTDVDEIWWPELQAWIDVTILGKATPFSATS